MKKKTTQTKMEKRFFLLIAILVLIAIGVKILIEHLSGG